MNEIDTSKPSRELDAAVALAMGWIQAEYDQIGGEWVGCDSDSRHRVLPLFSNSLAAWEIVEKYRLCVTPYGDDKWTAFEKGMGLSESGWNAAETMPLAVCKCALRINAEALARGE
jgi:hypothetical protein